ncbi:hypothetical protein AB0420_09940 [Streptomyces caelestis]|uniref:Uncharacterized protein n=1 Tax=Streptomyces heliomycini TaxID=284032 RepID=A0ABV5LG39_9ACTN|nr:MULTISPECIES: hypothetical protein [Streptomyces]
MPLPAERRERPRTAVSRAFTLAAEVPPMSHASPAGPADAVPGPYRRLVAVPG